MRVCEWLDWRAANGNFRDVSCRKALLQLHRRGMVQLPEADHVRFCSASQPRQLPIPDVPELTCDLKELGEARRA